MTILEASVILGMSITLCSTMASICYTGGVYIDNKQPEADFGSRTPGNEPSAPTLWLNAPTCIDQAAGSVVAGDVAVVMLGQSDAPLSCTPAQLVPIEDAVLDASPPRPNWAHSSTDENGRCQFTVSGVFPSLWCLRIIQPEGFEGDQAPLSSLVSIKCRDNSGATTLRLTKPDVITGVVADKLGQPLKNVEVFVHSLKGVLVGYTRTDEHGTFSVESVCGIESVLISLVLMQKGSTLVEGPTVLSTPYEPLGLAIATGVDIKGSIVLWPSGVKTGGTVYLYSSPPHRSPALFVRACKTTDGDYKLVDVEGGTYDLVGLACDGAVGVLSNIHVGPWSELYAYDVKAEKGSSAMLSYRGQREYCFYSVENQGVQIAFDLIVDNEEKEVFLLPGRNNIRMWEPSGTASMRRLLLCGAKQSRTRIQFKP